MVSSNLVFPLMISGPSTDISKYFVIYVLSSLNWSCVVSGESMIALKTTVGICTEIMLLCCFLNHYWPAFIYLKVIYLTECQLNKWYCSKGHAWVFSDVISLLVFIISHSCLNVLLLIVLEIDFVESNSVVDGSF